MIEPFRIIQIHTRFGYNQILVVLFMEVQDSPGPSKIVCTVSPFFCKAFMHGYNLQYAQQLPYNEGHNTGQNVVGYYI